MAKHPEGGSSTQTDPFSLSSFAETEKMFFSLSNGRKGRIDPTDREKRQLGQPVTPVSNNNMFTWHLNQHSVIENETDPELIRQRIWQRRVGVKESGRLTEAQIAMHEERLGIRLPTPWRDVYRHFNGGWVNTLYWGDLDAPRIDDLSPIPQSNHEYLALEDVASLRDMLPVEWEKNDHGILDGGRLDPRLIAIALGGTQAVLLDYRQGDDPRVCLAYFDKYDDDPLARWEIDRYTFWWPDMLVCSSLCVPFFVRPHKSTKPACQ